MRTIVEVEKKKRVIQLTHKEFMEEGWKTEIPDSPLLELEYKRKQGILIIKWSDIREEQK